MSKFKKIFEGIDRLIGSGAITSVEAFTICSSKASTNAVKRRTMCYILEYHMDEELEMHLNDTMGYDPNFHRIEVDLEGNITF